LRVLGLFGIYTLSSINLLTSPPILVAYLFLGSLYYIIAHHYTTKEEVNNKLR